MIPEFYLFGIVPIIRNAMYFVDYLYTDDKVATEINKRQKVQALYDKSSEITSEIAKANWFFLVLAFLLPSTLWEFEIWWMIIGIWTPYAYTFVALLALIFVVNPIFRILSPVTFAPYAYLTILFLQIFLVVLMLYNVFIF
jgi:hypothetical protein